MNVKTKMMKTVMTMMLIVVATVAQAQTVGEYFAKNRFLKGMWHVAIFNGGEKDIDQANYCEVVYGDGKTITYNKWREDHPFTTPYMLFVGKEKDIMEHTYESVTFNYYLDSGELVYSRSLKYVPGDDKMYLTDGQTLEGNFID